MHDAADHATIVLALDAAYARRQVRLNPSPLLITQPKEVLAHDPDPLPKTNQDRIVRLERLMSFDPRHDGLALPNIPKIYIASYLSGALVFKAEHTYR